MSASRRITDGASTGPRTQPCFTQKVSKDMQDGSRTPMLDCHHSPSHLPSLTEMASIPEQDSTNNKTLTLGVLAAYDFIARLFIGAVIPGLKTVQDQQLLPGYEIQWTWKETQCQPDTGFKAAIEIWQEAEDLDAIIGPTCSSVCQNVGLLTAAWNIPTVSYSCGSSVLSDTNTYPTFSRTVSAEITMVPFMTAAILQFGWDRVAIVATSQLFQSSLALVVKQNLEAAGVLVYYHIVNPVWYDDQIDESAITQMLSVIRTMKDEARVIVNFFYNPDRRVFLFLADDEGMISGEYVYFGQTMETSINDPIYRPEVDITPLLVGYLTVENPKTPPEIWQEFAEEVFDAYNDPQFEGFESPGTWQEVFSYAVFVHDAVVLWAHGVNRTLEDGGQADDGVDVTHHIYNYTFQGRHGPVTIDHKGDRKDDYALFTVQPNFTFVGMYHWHAASSELEKLYLPEEEDVWTGLLWAGGATQIPSGIPACGWNGEYCNEGEGSGAIVMAVACIVIAVAVLLLAALFYKRQVNRQSKDEVNQFVIDPTSITIRQRKQSRLIKVDQDDVSFGSNINNSADYSADNPIAGLNTDLAPRAYLHCHVGTNEVALKAYSHVTQTVDEKLSKEILMMKNTSRANLNTFYGICLGPQQTMVLMMYASKGSIYDIISQNNVRLTPDLQITLLADVARGMRHLHVHLAMCHGHLTSTNCVVDSRWVCKITDYGFTSIRRSQQSTNSMIDEKLLWTAPEILRKESDYSEAADVYSFGIILQEVITQQSPYACNEPHLNASEIVRNVMSKSNAPYRPCFESTEHSTKWLALAEQCWAEEPDTRPHSSDLLREVAKRNGGKIPNLIDSMVKNLEHHTKILEEIVEERSGEVREEQARMDALLKELLPDSIAAALKIGEQIVPEAFDEVTFFFSDIVGFTRVSSQSTPMQVVKMLNALYSQFDGVINEYDVYKVATIGDAYVVSSGAPVRNDKRHASEIAGMALDLISIVENYSIPHLSNEHLYMRIGIHTGPCVAGVTGIKTPRYLFFGETVDVAARIEAGGEKMRVHISGMTASILTENVDFEVDYHGEMEIKGVGVIRTYWLRGKRILG